MMMMMMMAVWLQMNSGFDDVAECSSTMVRAPATPHAAAAVGSCLSVLALRAGGHNRCHRCPALAPAAGSVELNVGQQEDRGGRTIQPRLGDPDGRRTVEVRGAAVRARLRRQRRPDGRHRARVDHRRPRPT